MYVCEKNIYYRIGDRSQRDCANSDAWDKEPPTLLFTTRLS